MLKSFLRKTLFWLSSPGGESISKLGMRYPWATYSILFLAVSIIFGLSHTQSVLYEGNQNTKFLHGLAMTGRGLLQEDWLANTIDPLPVFSYLVYFTALVNEKLFYAYYYVIFGIYVFGLIGIANALFNKRGDFYKSLFVFTVLLPVHAIYYIKMVENRHAFNMEFLQYGLANQYLLGEEFQNSAFGVVLLLSVLFFLHKRYTWAILWIGFACIMHSAYIFSAGLMVVAYLLVLLWEEWQKRSSLQERFWSRLLQSARQPFLLGLLALVMVAPVVLYNQLALADTSRETGAQALEILVHKRIPHHSLPEAWLDQNAYLQIGIMLVGVALSFRSRLFPVMLSLGAGGFLFTLIQILTGSDSLALVSPWRVSVLMVPISITLMIASLAFLFVDSLKLGRLPYALIVIALLAKYGPESVSNGIRMQEKYDQNMRVQHLLTVMEHVRQEKSSGDLYLIPPYEAEFDDFRIISQAPTFITWKSHPYKDVEVLEWYTRVERAQQFYTANGPIEQCDILAKLRTDYPITHVVLRGKDEQLSCSFTREDYRYNKYSIYTFTNP